METVAESGVLQAAITLFLGILGAGGTIYAARGQIRKTTGEQEGQANQRLIDNAIRLHEVYKKENDGLREENHRLEQVIEDIKQALNKVSQENVELKRRILALEARLDTGDLTA